MPASNLLTHSRLATSRRCKREHRIKYELGYRPVNDAEELFFGSLMHVGLEAWWLSVKSGRWEAEGLLAALGAMRSVKCDPFDLARAEAMMRGYDARWSSDAAQYEVVAVERKFETDLVNPETGKTSKTWRLGGKLDVVLRERATGRLVFMEHKTSSEDVSPGSTYYRRLQMDGQVSIYFDGTAALGLGDPDACLYDVLAKPGQRPKQVPVLDERGLKVVLDAKGERVYTGPGKARQTGDTERGFVVQTRPETPDEYMLRCAEAIASDIGAYFGRVEVVRLEQELRDARFDIWAQGKEIRENQLAGRAQRNPEACRRNGNALCPFFDVCTGQASLDDPSRFRRVDDVHPELAVEAAEENPALAGATSSNSEQSPREVG